MRAIFATIAIAPLRAGHGRRRDLRESAAGRPLEVQRVGDPAAPVRVLVVGSIHGNEPAGHAVVRRLRAARAAGRRPALARRAREPRRRRRRARGRTPAASTSTATSRSAGPAAGGRSTRTSPGPAARRSRRRARCRRWSPDVRPDLTLYYHQHMRLVVLPRGRRPRAGARVRPPRRAAGPLAAALPRHRDQLAEPSLRRAPPRSWSSCPPARSRAAPPLATRARCSRSPPAARAPPAAARAQAARSTGTRSRSAPTASARCARYSRRHYGDGKAKLVDPKVIVEHYTASTTTAPRSTRSRATRPTSSSASDPASAPTS